MPLTRSEDARQWLETKAGYTRAQELIRREAYLLRVDPASDITLQHALVTFEAETGHRYPKYSHVHHMSWEPPAEQEELI